MDRIRIGSVLLQRLEEIGIAPLAVLQRARLPQTLLHQERATINTAQFFALWNAIGELNDNPALGLEIGSSGRVGPYDPLLIAALSARSFFHGLQNMARYKRLFCSEELCILEQDGQWTIEVSWMATRHPTPALLLDIIFASLVELGRRGTGQPLYPNRVAFKRAPQQRAMYEAHFRCPVEFEAKRNMMVYSREAIAQPFRTHNPDMLALLIPPLEVALREELAQQGVVAQVTALLRNRLAGQPPTIQDIAHELHMSARTLQRRLADDGARFQQLLDAVRREMAEHYLTASSLELSEIAYLLGYEEANSFHRAFHQWAGTSPGQWRAAQRLPAA